MKIKVEDIPNQNKANELMNKKNIGNMCRFTAITRITGLCCKCHEKPAIKKVMYRISGGYRVERYCKEHFHHHSYEKPNKRIKKVNKK